MIFDCFNSVPRKKNQNGISLASWHIIKMKCHVVSISLEKFHVTRKLPGQWDFWSGFVLCRTLDFTLFGDYSGW